MAICETSGRQHTQGTGPSVLPRPQAHDEDLAMLSPEELDVLRAIYAEASAETIKPSRRVYNGTLRRTNFFLLWATAGPPRPGARRDRARHTPPRAERRRAMKTQRHTTKNPDVLTVQPSAPVASNEALADLSIDEATLILACQRAISGGTNDPRAFSKGESLQRTNFIML